ncbi:MAG: DUF3857 domain-containing protein [Dysgonomonas sp.]
MKKLLLLIAISATIGFQHLFSQTKFGDATVDELNMVSYPQDTTASAVILLKDAEMNFVYDEMSGFQYEYTLKMKIKILKNEGLDWCDQQISYYESSRTLRERINNLSGTTYNLENGKVVKTKLSKDNIFDENVNEKSKLKKFTIPAAKVGSVIEYKYTIVSDYYFDLRDFYFQSSVPTAYVKYEVTIPEYFIYNLNMQGYINILTKKTPENLSFNIRYKDNNGRTQSTMHNCGGTKTVFTGTDIPAMKDEGYVWTIKDYISKVTFELSQTHFPGSMVKNYTSTWNDVDKEFFDSSVFGGNLKKAGMFKDEISKKEATLDNAREILNIIKYRVKWDDNNSLYPNNMGDAFKKGLGNSGDMNFLLYNALKAGGFDAYPVVLSTRSNGLIPMTHPSLSSFNYTIVAVKIDTTTYFTDASSKYGDWNILPRKCMVAQARILDQRSSSWVDLTKITSGSTTIIGEYQFENNQYVGKIQRVYRDEDALDFKIDYSDYKSKEEYIEKLASKLSNEVTQFELKGVEDAGTTIKNDFMVVRPDVTLGEDYIYIDPLVMKQFTDNPFKAETRDVPIMFGNLGFYRQLVSIIIPDGYEVDELPKPERIVFGDNGAISLAYRIDQADNKIVLNYQFSLKDLVVLQTDYTILRDFFAKIVTKNSEQIVLKKKA